jgi:hypothetical protein
MPGQGPVTIGRICFGIRVGRGGTREEIRSFREQARAAHDYSADISDKVQRGRQRWAGKSYWGGRRPYGRMIDPSARKHAKRLITVPEEANVLQHAATGVPDPDSDCGHRAMVSSSWPVSNLHSANSCGSASCS